MVGVGGFDDMDFDALEAMQCMLERRKGGETGVKAVQLLEGDDVWIAQERGTLVEGSAEFRLITQRHSAGPDSAGRPQSGPRNQRSLAAVGERPRCLLHRVRRRNARHAAHAQRRHQGLQHRRAARRAGSGLKSILHATCAQRDLFGVPRREDRTDVSDSELTLSGRTLLADNWPAGGVLELPSSGKSKIGNT